MNGHEVRPAKWSDVIDLYDDGYYSAIWGRYENAPWRALGVRWNGDGAGKGFPLSSGHPVWHVEPDFITNAILSSLLERTLSVADIGGNKDNILTAMTEFGLRHDHNRIHMAVALYAAGSRGKTTTLKLLINNLVMNGAKELERVPLLEGSPDLLFSCKYNGRTIGVATAGDNEIAIRNAFDFFNKYNCDIVFCGTRSRSDSNSWQEFSKNTRPHHIRVLCVRKREAEEKDYGRINSEQAKELMDIIERN